MRYLWVVEIWHAAAKRWEPTVGVRLNRVDGRQELADWRMDNPSDRFQLVKYVVSE